MNEVQRLNNGNVSIDGLIICLRYGNYFIDKGKQFMKGSLILIN